jgi:polo-like kinase 1
MENGSKLNLNTRRTEKQKGDNMAEKLVYVRRWFRSKHAVIFRLSNKSVQVIFVDQSELLISSIRKEVQYINKKKEKIQYGLNEIMGCENK